MRIPRWRSIIGQLVLVGGIAWGGVPLALPGAEAGRTTQSFDAGWRFVRGDIFNAESNRFDDAAWEQVDVPHDWAIAGPYDEAALTRRGGGYLPSGVSWYRKTFVLPQEWEGRKIYIEFDGVMANSRVWINGYHLGERPNGYISFRYDLTENVRFGENRPNVIAVRTDTSLQPASRWYTGQGIYRHVRLVAAHPMHLEPWSTHANPLLPSASGSTVQLQTTLRNDSTVEQRVSVQGSVLSPTGAVVSNDETSLLTIPVGEAREVELNLVVARPELWELDHPALYQAHVQVWSGRDVLDEEKVTFGIRDARFDAATGFWLNGENLKIEGVCLHHDGGAVGAAVPLRVWERRLENLRQLGVNAVRTAHNPPAPEFLDLCDRMGFLVMDEVWDAWTYGKNHANYGIQLHFREWWERDTRDTVLRDRNHPSVILWSAGNEIHDTPHPELAKQILGNLIGVFHEYDPSRPVTQALFRPNVSHDYDNGLADMLDVVGQNYRERELVAAHRQDPNRKVIGTENQHGANVWLALRDNDFMSGQFLWAGIDYLGEADWPAVNSASGLLDRTGAIKARAYERQSWWSNEPMVRMVRRAAPGPPQVVDPGYETVDQQQQQNRRGSELFQDWTPLNREPHRENVEVYSNAEAVELFLNGQSLGRKEVPEDASPLNWNVPFVAGTIRAEATSSGMVVATHELRTAGAPHHLLVETDRASLLPDWDDVAHVTVSIVDADGVIVPDADHLVSFAVRGPGSIIGVDNGNRTSHEPYQANQRRAYQGSCLAIVRANDGPGVVSLTATVAGLPPAAIEIATRSE